MSTCSDCGYSSPKWFGRCPGCNAWSTARATTGEVLVPVALSTGVSEAPERWTTGLGDVDRVLGGGLVPGSVVLLAGEPGIGKSTFVLQLLDALARAGQRALLVTGEESVGQVALRGRRLGVDADALRVAATTSVAAVIGAAAASDASAVVVDSIQSLDDADSDSAPGSPLQVRRAAAELVACAKATETSFVIVGHVTKDGTIAGPKTLEHAVDAVLTIEGERHGAIRVLRAAKNRFGSCEETAVFVMGTRGLEPVVDPSALLLADRVDGVSGSVVFPSLEGTRPMLVEIQALVVEAASSAQARRVAIGLDARRLSLLIGILSQRADTKLASSDVFVAAAGGIAVREPAADLALCIALASAHSEIAIAHDVVAFGEVGLSGEVRRVPGVERRLVEAARLGFSTALVPPGAYDAPRGLTVIPVNDLKQALERAPEQAVARASEDGGRATLGSTRAPLEKALSPT